MLKEAIALEQPKFDHRIHQLQGLAGLSQKQLDVPPGLTDCATNHQEKIDIPLRLGVSVGQSFTSRFDQLLLTLCYRSGVKSH